jgi:polyisoprenoid-binding protein YceI
MENTEFRPEKWVLDKSHSEIHFRVRHMMISWVGGYFQDFEGDFFIPDSGFESLRADLRIRVDSINTGNENRDEHLRNIDFFDSGRFPEITFQSTGFEYNPNGAAKLIGVLCIHGNERTVELTLNDFGLGKDPWGNERACFSISANLNRRDFGISWNTSLETGGVLIGEEVKIRAELQLIKKKKDE